MVRTRAMSMFVQSPSELDVLAEIRARALGRRRRRRTTPRKRSFSNYLKEKKLIDEKRMNDLTDLKKNLSKAFDRVLKERPTQEPNAIDHIHNAIKSGAARRALKPIPKQDN